MRIAERRATIAGMTSTPVSLKQTRNAHWIPTVRCGPRPVEAPLVIESAQAQAWDDAADLVVVGLGGAGVAAALEAAEHGASVLAFDRYEGGGSSAANGGVYYAGGGTRSSARRASRTRPRRCSST